MVTSSDLNKSMAPHDKGYWWTDILIYDTEVTKITAE